MDYTGSIFTVMACNGVKENRYCRKASFIILIYRPPIVTGTHFVLVRTGNNARVTTYTTVCTEDEAFAHLILVIDPETPASRLAGVQDDGT